MATSNRWLRPEVYPLFAAVGVAVGICGLQLVRNMLINPEVSGCRRTRESYFYLLGPCGGREVETQHKYYNGLHMIGGAVRFASISYVVK